MGLPSLREVKLNPKAQVNANHKSLPAQFPFTRNLTDISMWLASKVIWSNSKRNHRKLSFFTLHQKPLSIQQGIELRMSAKKF
jgi:hypothetical protein